MNGLLLVLTLIGPLKLEHTPPPVQEQQFVSVHTGDSVKELKQAYGKPMSVLNETSYATGEAYQQWIYHDGPCAGPSCSVIVINGKVSKVSGAKPELM